MGTRLSKDVADLPFGYTLPRKNRATDRLAHEDGGHEEDGDDEGTGEGETEDTHSVDPRRRTPAPARRTRLRRGLALPYRPRRNIAPAEAHRHTVTLGELTKVNSLGLCGRGFVELAPHVARLDTTYYLQLCCNQLITVPAELGYMRNLTVLDLARNRLTHLPAAIGYLSKLVALTLTDNYLTTLPPTVGRLPKLTVLHLANNRLTALPPELGRLHALFTLDVSGNPLTVLPAELTQLPHLRKLKLHRCPLLTALPGDAEADIPPPAPADPLARVPRLAELAARTLVRECVPLSARVPADLRRYVASVRFCTHCQGPYYETVHRRWRFLTKSNKRIPLEYRLCSPHWHTEAERVQAMFAPPPTTGLVSPLARRPRNLTWLARPTFTTPTTRHQPLPNLTRRPWWPRRRQATPAPPVSPPADTAIRHPASHPVPVSTVRRALQGHPPAPVALAYSDLLPATALTPLPPLPPFPAQISAVRRPGPLSPPSSSMPLDTYLTTRNARHPDGEPRRTRPDPRLRTLRLPAPSLRSLPSSGASSPAPPYVTPSVFSDPNSLAVGPASSVYSFPASPDSLTAVHLPPFTAPLPPTGGRIRETNRLDPAPVTMTAAEFLRAEEDEDEAEPIGTCPSNPPGDVDPVARLSTGSPTGAAAAAAAARVALYRHSTGGGGGLASSSWQTGGLKPYTAVKAHQRYSFGPGPTPPVDAAAVRSLTDRVAIWELRDTET